MAAPTVTCDEPEPTKPRSPRSGSSPAGPPAAPDGGGGRVAARGRGCGPPGPVTPAPDSQAAVETALGVGATPNPPPCCCSAACPLGCCSPGCRSVCCRPDRYSALGG